MYRLLLKLWWTQTWRNFTWKDVLVAVYTLIMLVCVAVGFYLGMDEAVGSLSNVDFSSFAVTIIAGVLVVDWLTKAVMHKEATIMDDYLRSRPFRQRTWDAFLLTTNTVGFWTWAIPAILAVVFFLFMPVGNALLAVAAAWSMSMVNAMTLTCYRRADSWWLRWPMLVVAVFFFAGSLAYGILMTAFDVSPVVQLSLYTLLNIGATALLYVYLTHLHCYDEHTTKTKRVRNLNVASAFTLELAGLLRAKRIKQMVMLVTAIMVFDAWMMLGIDDPDAVSSTYFILSMAICMPSVVLGQWTFGVEANFFDGLWTKPVSIYQILNNKFRFFALLNLGAALLMTPTVVLGWVDGWLLAALLVYTVGMVNLVCMPTCLFSTRLDLFSSAFFNYQGANLKINIYSFIVLLPIGAAWLLLTFTSLPTATIALAALGLLALAVHPWALRQLAQAFIRRRHARFEAYMR